jgi:hypothetical protein
MALKASPFQPGQSETGKCENWGRPSGGAGFPIARTGGDFIVPIRKAVWHDRQKIFGDGKELIRLPRRRLNSQVVPDTDTLQKNCFVPHRLAVCETAFSAGGRQHSKFDNIFQI